MINRRNFIKMIGYGLAGLATSDFIKPKKLISNNSQLEHLIDTITPIEFQKLPSPDYHDISYNKINWNNISKGLDFSRVEVYRSKELVDIIAILNIDPNFNIIKVINGYNSPKNSEIHTIEEWQEKTEAIAMINSAQYMADPYYMPCALVICDGKQKGPKYNRYVSGMFVAEPKKGLENKLQKADLLDFDYDKFDHKTTSYLQGVQHWPILLDREEKIKVGKSLWQANRTVVAKTKDNKILFITTEGGFFTLYTLGRFLKESNQRQDKGFNIHTALNMDGGYEADMIVRTPKISYVTYGKFETYGPGKDATIFNIKIKIPGVIGVFPRDN